MKLIPLIVCISLAQCGPLPPPSLQQPHPIDDARWSKPHSTMQDMEIARLDCLEHHQGFFFACMGSKGWVMDPAGFAHFNWRAVK